VNLKPESTPSETIGGRLREAAGYLDRVGYNEDTDAIADLLREAADEYERLRRRVQEVEGLLGLSSSGQSERPTVHAERTK
jgi:hypothetical protein